MKKICITGSLHWDIILNTNNIPKKMRQLKVQKLITYLEAKGGIKLYQQIAMDLTPTLLEELERTILGKKFLIH